MSKAQLVEIAEIKKDDLNAADTDAAVRMLAGTGPEAMGIPGRELIQRSRRGALWVHGTICGRAYRLVDHKETTSCRRYRSAERPSTRRTSTNRTLEEAAAGVKPCHGQV